MNTQEITETLIISLFEEMEESVLAYMAAGVPSSELTWIPPKMVYEPERVYLQAFIGFKS